MKLFKREKIEKLLWKAGKICILKIMKRQENNQLFPSIKGSNKGNKDNHLLRYKNSRWNKTT